MSSSAQRDEWPSLPHFQGIGHIEPSSNVNSIATGISGDGQTVIGYSTSADGVRGFGWRQGSGMYGVSPKELSLESASRGISYDGRWIVGSGFNGKRERQEGFIWDQQRSSPRLLRFSGVFGSISTICREGTFALGIAQTSANAPCGLVVWNLANMSTQSITGAKIGCPTLNLCAHAMSSDGQQLVGYATNDAGAAQLPFHYNRTNDRMQRLRPLVNGFPDARPLAMNAAGTLAVGMSMTADGTRACLWHDWSEPPVELPGTPSGSESRAVAVSADGSVITGNYNSGASDDTGVLWLKTPAGQYELVSFGDHLRQARVAEAETLRPIAIAGVSDDGRYICGSAVNLSNRGVIEPFYAELR